MRKTSARKNARQVPKMHKTNTTNVCAHVVDTIPSDLCVLPEISSLRAGSSNSSLLSQAAFIAPRAFASLTLTRFFGSCRLAKFSVMIVQLFPFVSFNSLDNGLTEGVPVRINWRRSPPLKLNMFCVSEGPLRAHFLSPQR